LVLQIVVVNQAIVSMQKKVRDGPAGVCAIRPLALRVEHFGAPVFNYSEIRSKLWRTVQFENRIPQFLFQVAQTAHSSLLDI